MITASSEDNGVKLVDASGVVISLKYATKIVNVSAAEFSSTMRALKRQRSQIEESKIASGQIEEVSDAEYEAFTSLFPRHQKEKEEMEDKKKAAMKKAAKSGNKQKQKEVNDEFEKLEKDQKRRHCQELATVLWQRDDDDDEAANSSGGGASKKKEKRLKLEAQADKEAAKKVEKAMKKAAIKPSASEEKTNKLTIRQGRVTIKKEDM